MLSPMDVEVVTIIIACLGLLLCLGVVAIDARLHPVRTGRVAFFLVLAAMEAWVLVATRDVWPGPPFDADAVSMALAYGAFWLIVITLWVTWIIQSLLRPTDRMEWAEFGKITAFLAVVMRTAWTLQTGRTLPPHVAVVFWVICFFLVLNYLVAMLDRWGPPVARAIFRIHFDQRNWVIPAMILLLFAAGLYALLH